MSVTRRSGELKVSINCEKEKWKRILGRR